MPADERGQPFETQRGCHQCQYHHGRNDRRGEKMRPALPTDAGKCLGPCGEVEYRVGQELASDEAEGRQHQEPSSAFREHEHERESRDHQRVHVVPHEEDRAGGPHRRLAARRLHSGNGVAPLVRVQQQRDHGVER
jgi:hypothetical protein